MIGCFGWNFVIIILEGCVFLVVCGISALYHIIIMCRSFLFLKLGDQVGSEYIDLNDKIEIVEKKTPSNSPPCAIYGPTMFQSSLLRELPGFSRQGASAVSMSLEQPGLNSSASGDMLRSMLSTSPSKFSSSPYTRPDGFSAAFAPVADKSASFSSRSAHAVCSASLLDIALSPITGPPVLMSDTTELGYRLSNSTNMFQSTAWSSPRWSSVPHQPLQYQLSCSTSACSGRSWLEDPKQKSTSSLKTSLSDLGFLDTRYSRQNPREQPMERSSDEYWNENKITASCLAQWTMDLRKWLHGTIVRRLVDEIAAVNRHFNETSGEEVAIGSTTLETLQQLCSTKYQYLPTLPVLLSFLEFSKDHGYLVNRLKELARGSCLEDFRWDSGSRSSSWPWKEHLPNDSLILLHLFATYMDTRMPAHPKCLTGRVFSQLCIVRHPDKPDLKSKFNSQLYQVTVQPPHFKLVLDGKLYSFQPVRSNPTVIRLFSGSR
ncbi:transmembrane protein 209 [Clonorchis sinensis]|uniref:Transmembrane protein 209 n=1 Tax=Clonorchis sinensis TaxID=79923 RepID=G7YLS3_CLOSI|nr:transmembrane protein 209 [Clonorchis sinensis]